MGNLNDGGWNFMHCEYCEPERQMYRNEGQRIPPKRGDFLPCESCQGGHLACPSCRKQVSKTQGRFPTWFEVLTKCPVESDVEAFPQ